MQSTAAQSHVYRRIRRIDRALMVTRRPAGRRVPIYTTAQRQSVHRSAKSLLRWRVGVISFREKVSTVDKCDLLLRQSGPVRHIDSWRWTNDPKRLGWGGDGATVVSVGRTCHTRHALVACKTVDVRQWTVRPTVNEHTACWVSRRPHSIATDCLRNITTWWTAVAFSIDKLISFWPCAIYATRSL